MPDFMLFLLRYGSIALSAAKIFGSENFCVLSVMPSRSKEDSTMDPLEDEYTFSKRFMDFTNFKITQDLLCFLVLLKVMFNFCFFLRGLLGMLFFQSDSQAKSQGLMRMGHPLYCKETPMWRIRFSFTTTVWKKLWPKITGLLLKGWRRDESLELQPWQMVIWYRCWLLISLRNTGIAWGSLPLLEPHNVESQLPKS